MALTINLGLSAEATGVDTITATYSPAPTLVDKNVLFLRTAGANTSTTPTFSPNGLTAHTIVKNGQPLIAGDLQGVVILMYDLTNTRWELLTPKGIDLTQDQLEAIYNSNSPTGANPFATISDVSTPTLSDILNYSNSVGLVKKITSTNGKGDVNFDNTETALEFIDGSSQGVVRVTSITSELSYTDGVSQTGGLQVDSASNKTLVHHTSQIELTSPSVTKNGVEIATVDDITSVDVNTIGSAINGASSATPNDTDLVMSVESSVAKKNTWTQVKAFLKTYFDTVYTTTSAVATQITTALSGYLTSATASSTYQTLANKDASGGYAGLTLFKINFKNVANTFTSFFTNSNTASRTYTFKDADGTIAFTSDIPSITPAALTKVDDTNVTLTLGGTPTTALLQSTSLTLGWTGTLADGRIASASTWNAKESALTFSTGLTRSVNTITNNLSLGVSGGQSVIGGTAVGDALTFKSTTGNGTTSVAGLVFNVGNNGATNAMNIFNDGQVTVNGSTQAGGSLTKFRTTVGTGTVDLGERSSANGAIWLSQSTPTSTNYSLSASGTTGVVLNAPSSAGSLILAFGGSTRYTFQTDNVSLTPVATAASSQIPFNITAPASTNQTASTEVNGLKYVLTTSRQWATGALATQREWYLTAPTYRFLGASTITNAYNLYVEAPVAGTNATITNNYALGVNGASNFLGNIYTSGTQVVSTRVTGYTAWTGTLNKATAYDASTVTLTQLAQRVAQIQADLTTHGLIGA